MAEVGPAVTQHDFIFLAKGTTVNLKIGQVNLGRGFSAMKECLHAATVDGLSLVLLQEPYVGAKAHVSSNFRVIQKKTQDRSKPVRAAVVVVDPNLDIVENVDLMYESIMGFIIRVGTIRIGIINVYLDGTIDIEEDFSRLQNVIVKLKTPNIIIGGDINSASPWWGCREEDGRGAKFVEFATQYGLNILNEGTTPTFYIHRGQNLYTSIVDVTACSTSLLGKIGNWRVNKEAVTLSDHRQIDFEIQLKCPVLESKRQGTRIFNTRKADWEKFRGRLKETLEEKQITPESTLAIGTGAGIEILVGQYTDAILQTCNEAIPAIPLQRKGKKINWWTNALTEKKQEMLRYRRRIRHANPDRRSLVVDQYKESKQGYKDLMQATINASWMEFCTKEEKETVWQRSYRVLKICEGTAAERLLRPDPDSDTLGPAESAELLAKTFYPWDEQATDNEEQARVRSEVHDIIRAFGEDQGSQHDCPDFTLEELKVVYSKMNPKKSPGEDGLTSDICQNCFEVAPLVQLGIFNRCLRLGYFPGRWKIARIKVIPKPGKEDYSTPKSYRPIGLLSVMGKVLEKLVATRVSWYLGGHARLSSRQYGFVPQRGTEDALYDSISMVREGVIRNKEIVAVISLDIEGAFDNCWWPGIIKQLHEKKIDGPTLRLITSYLSDRSVNLAYMNELVSRKTNKGCVQGSICGPLFWNVQLNPLLEVADTLSAHIQAFADDILVVARAKTTAELETKVNEALGKIAEWGTEYKMRFAAHKTQAIVLTRKLKYDSPRFELNGQPLELADSLKVLGLTVDRSLNFRAHLDNIYRKTVNIFKMTSRAVKTQWGLNPEIMRLLYLVTVEPVVLYAASAWASTVDRKFVKARLDHITRMFALKISRAHRTTSLVSSALISRILPLDLRLREQASLYEVKRGKPFDELPGRELEMRVSPSQRLHPAERKHIGFGSITSQQEADGIGNDWPRLFTDGSKLDGRLGAAVSCWRGDAEFKSMKIKLANYCTVFQAEMAAILRAVLFLKHSCTSGNIISDSRSSLEAISDPCTENPVAAEIQQMLAELNVKNIEVKLHWIKAHVGILGNERADILAKEATLKKSAPAYEAFPLSFARRSIREKTLEEWQRRYTESTTGEVTKLFFPEVKKAYKIVSRIGTHALRTQLFSGHTGIKAYLNRFKLADDPFCTCNDASPETILHIILECPKYGLERHDCECRIDQKLSKDSMCEVMDDDNRRTHFLFFAESILRRAAKANGSTIV